MVYLITWNAAAIIEVRANVHAACPDGAQHAAVVGPPRASRCQALGLPSTLSRWFPPAMLPPLPPPTTALRAGQHLLDVGLEVFPFCCPVAINDLLVIVIVLVVVIVVVVVVLVVIFVVIVVIILVIIVAVVVLARLCPVIIPLPHINRAIIPLFILYQPSFLLLEPSSLLICGWQWRLAAARQQLVMMGLGAGKVDDGRGRK